MLSHANLLTNIRTMGRLCQVTPADVFVSWLPLYHDMGLIGAWLGSLCHGCRLVIMPPLSFLARPSRWLQAIHRYSGTLSAAPNFGYELCCTRIEEAELAEIDLSSWRLAFNGAEPVSPSTIERFRKRYRPYGLPATAMTPVYGLAECSLGLAFPVLGSEMRIDRVDRETFARSGRAVPVSEPAGATLEFVACGQPLPGHQIRVVDTGDRELPERREGRLQFKGPSATSGYYRNPDQTRRLFRGKWLATGDLGYIAAGEVYPTGRVKDVIIRGGRNIYPHELEEVIGNIDGIRKGCVAVFAARVEKRGTERLVVLAESRRTTDEERRALKREVNAAATDLLGMACDEVVIAPPGSVLKTSSGKIRRSACLKLYESGKIGRRKAGVRLQLLRLGLGSIPPLTRRLAGRLAAAFFAIYSWLLFGIAGATLWCALQIVPRGATCWRLTGQTVRLIAWLTGTAIRLTGQENIPCRPPLPAGRQPHELYRFVPARRHASGTVQHHRQKGTGRQSSAGQAAAKTGHFVRRPVRCRKRPCRRTQNCRKCPPGSSTAVFCGRNRTTHAGTAAVSDGRFRAGRGGAVAAGADRHPRYPQYPARRFLVSTAWRGGHHLLPGPQARGIGLAVGN